MGGGLLPEGGASPFWWFLMIFGKSHFAAKLWLGSKNFVWWGCCSSKGDFSTILHPLHFSTLHPKKTNFPQSISQKTCFLRFAGWKGVKFGGQNVGTKSPINLEQFHHTKFFDPSHSLAANCDFSNFFKVVVPRSLEVPQPPFYVQFNRLDMPNIIW